jgi:hypothetical protein
VKHVLDGTVALVTGLRAASAQPRSQRSPLKGAAVGLAERRRDLLDTLAAGIRDQGAECIQRGSLVSGYACAKGLGRVSVRAADSGSVAALDNRARWRQRAGDKGVSVGI